MDFEDQPCLRTPMCDRDGCTRRFPCAPCRKHTDDALTELVRITEEAGGYDDELSGVLAYTPDDEWERICRGEPIIVSAEAFDDMTYHLENPRLPTPELVALFRDSCAWCGDDVVDPVYGSYRRYCSFVCRGMAGE